MAKGGKKYRLLLYEHMLDRWWPTVFALGLAIFLYVGILWGAEQYLPAHMSASVPRLSNDNILFLSAVGGIVILFSIFLFGLRKMAYMQLFSDHFKLVTPFLRLKISYKRVHHTTTTQVSQLFPPQKMSGQQRDVIAPISGNTAIIIHLTSYPLSRSILRFFLSPFFFYDKTPHFVLLVDDWMGLNRELESRRTGGGGSAAPRKKSSSMGIPSLLDGMRKDSHSSHKPPFK
jgi:hypothetical protein